jgi:hypothetical protein
MARRRCLADGDYTLLCQDAFGDGWHGGHLVLTDAFRHELAYCSPTKYNQTVRPARLRLRLHYCVSQRLPRSLSRRLSHCVSLAVSHCVSQRLLLSLPLCTMSHRCARLTVY